MLTKEQIEKQLAYWRSNPGHGPTFADFEPVAETAIDALAEVQRLREAVEALVVVLDRNDKKGPIPDVEMTFCWLASQGVRAAFRKIAQKGEAT